MRQGGTSRVRTENPEGLTCIGPEKYTVYASCLCVREALAGERERGQACRPSLADRDVQPRETPKMRPVCEYAPDAFGRIDAIGEERS